MTFSRSDSLTAVSTIVQAYLGQHGPGDQPASLRAFAALLSESLQSYERQLSHQSIKNWLDQRHLPDRFLMHQIADIALHDWRGDFALDILAALDPGSHRPASIIGRRALSHHLTENKA
ncbi:MAG: hypothetical protein DWG76_02355 [Chloroflexi bacterium]|nr:hypothetical protein [Chloroflexota bacterium]